MTDTDNIRLLCTGDLHLGRHPARIPEDIDDRQFSPAHVWQSIVDLALRSAVDAVCITGDVLDAEENYFEAYGTFARGARRLKADDVPLLAVGGNHDADILPRLVEDMGDEAAHLLGKGGTWERYTLENNGRAVDVEGWSFPEDTYRRSPVAEKEFGKHPGRPLIGLLHADLDGAESSYAPVSREELVATPHDAWLLGHIHAGKLVRDDDPVILYSGSPQPLDPGEPGRHGPWMVEIPAHHTPSARLCPMATVRYETVELDVSGMEDTADLPPALEEVLEHSLGETLERGAPELLLVRLVITGRCPVHSELEAERERLARDLVLSVAGVPTYLEELHIRSSPAVDLAELAEADGSPAARLAELLVKAEETPDEMDEALADRALQAMRRTYRSSAYSPLRRSDDPPPRPDREMAIDVLRRQGRLMLDTLLKQKEASDE